MSKNFISVNEAKSIVDKILFRSKIITIPVVNASGYVLAENVKAKISSPPFNNSAMDGYAFRWNEFNEGKVFRVVGESTAGRMFNSKISKGECVRIFTGAEVPIGADTVVMQEKVTITKNGVIINDKLLQKGGNIRKAGSQIKKGAVALNKYHRINSATIGFLSSLGETKIKVFSKPAISIIVTGNELVQPGKRASTSQIFESNSQTILSALKYEGIVNCKLFFAKDNLKSTSVVFKSALKFSDIVLFTGGISEGDYDFVNQVLDNEKVMQLFYKVKQKPGKPLYAGIKNGKVIFGLPGNPAAVLTCYLEYVLPAILKFQQRTQVHLPQLRLPLKNHFKKKAGLTCFLKAHTDLNLVTVLEGQESYIMKSFSQANCFVVADELSEQLLSGDLVTVHYFGDV